MIKKTGLELHFYSFALSLVFHVICEGKQGLERKEKKKKNASIYEKI